MNRLKKVYTPNNVESRRITYKDTESPEAVIDSLILLGGASPQWKVNKRLYGGFGNVIQTKQFDFDNSQTIVKNISYNGNGKVDSVSNPYTISGTSYDYSTPSWSGVTRAEYDGLDRLSKIIKPDNYYLQCKYNANVDTVYDELGNRTIYKYNALGMIYTVIDAKNNLTLYTYDRIGNLLTVTDADNKQTTYVYDKAGRIIYTNGPDATLHDTADLYFGYDKIGNLIHKRDANGYLRLNYDNINRLTKIEFSVDSSSWSDKVRLTWDVATAPVGSGYNNAKGRVGKFVTCDIDSIKYYYDDQGRLGLKRVNIVGLEGEKSITFKYNTADQCTLVYLSSSNKAIYQYNRLGNVKSIPGLVSSIKTNPAGQLSPLNYANSTNDTIMYDNLFQATEVKTTKTGDPGNIMRLGYTYQANSNIDSIADYVNTTWSQGFNYDSLNRLIGVTSSVGNQSFTYDKVGNRKSKNGTNYTNYR